MALFVLPLHSLALFGRSSSSADACAPEPNPPAQERMAPARRAERQAQFGRHVDPRQPTLRELLAAPSSYAGPTPGAYAPVTVILNHYKRHTICRQIEALQRQSAPPQHIWLCLFASPMARAARAAALAYNDSRIAVFEGEHNFKYFGRFQLALAVPTRYFFVFDDDIIPGDRYIQTLLHAAGTRHARHALLGSIGWLLPRPQPDRTLGSYRALRNGSGGLYVPDAAYDIYIERLLEVDYLCSMWFGEAAWVRLLFREAPFTYATGEDFQLSHMLRKHAAVRSLLLPVGRADKAEWGDTDHALAYGRYSTGGAATIQLRDQIWWHGVQSGSTLHWAAAAAAPAVSLASAPPSSTTTAAPLGSDGLLAVVDGPRHARALRPALHAARARAPTVAALSGGVRGGCSDVTAELGLAVGACAQRRLAVLDMETGRDQPRVEPSAAALATAGPAGPGPASRARNASWGARGTRGAARHEAEAARDLGQMLLTARPARLLSVRDATSGASRAAAAVAGLLGLPHAALPPDAPAWAASIAASLPAPALARWSAVRLTISVLSSGGAAPLAALAASLRRVALLRQAAELGEAQLSLLLSHASPTATAEEAMRWDWPAHTKHLRYRIEPAAAAALAGLARSDGSNCSEHLAAQARESVARAESWAPPPADGAAPAAGLLLDDGVELSEGFYLYLRHYLAQRPAATTGHLLGLALGAPAAAHEAEAEERAEAGMERAAPSGCASLYLAPAWRELQRFAAARLEQLVAAASAAGRCAEAAADADGHGWAGLQRRFMRERGYRMHYPRVRLCRRQGDSATRLATGDEVAAALREAELAGGWGERSQYWQ